MESGYVCHRIMWTQLPKKDFPPTHEGRYQVQMILLLVKNTLYVLFEPRTVLSPNQIHSLPWLHFFVQSFFSSSGFLYSFPLIHKSCVSLFWILSFPLFLCCPNSRFSMLVSDSMLASWQDNILTS